MRIKLTILKLFIVLICSSALANPLWSAEVMGVDEPASANPPVDEQPARSDRSRRARAPHDDFDSETSAFQDIGVSGALGFSGGFSANLSVSVGLNRYMAVATSGFYQSWETDDQAEVRYGPEVDLVLRYPNSSMFTPYIGAGPGFEKWKRTKNDVTWDSSSSIMANYFIGLNLSLSRHFGFQIQSKWITYVNDPPRDWKNGEEKESPTQTRIGVGFYVAM